MIRLFRFSLGAVGLLAISLPLLAAWVGGRGQGNAGAYPSTPWPATPALLWKSYRGDDVVGQAPSNALLAGKNVIVAFGNRLCAVSADTGELSWKQTLAAPPLGDLLLLDDQIIVTQAAGKVLALNPADGTTLWQRSFNAHIANSPSFTDDVLALTTDADQVEVLARKTGKSIASIDVDNPVIAAPLQIGKAIMLFLKNGRIFRAENGQVTWTVTLPKNPIRQSPVTDGSVILITAGETVYALNTASMTKPYRWIYPCPGLVDQPTLGGKVMYLATTSGQLRAVDIASGKDRWGARGILLPAPAVAAPLVIGDQLVVAMEHGWLGAFARETGALTWRYRLPSAAETLPVAGVPVVDGQDLFFGASDGAIYHFSTAAVDVDPPVFREILPVKDGIDFSIRRPLTFVGARIVDEGSGVQADSVTIQLDGEVLTRNLQYDVKSGYYFVWLPQGTVPAPGMHQLTLTARDQRGNAGTVTARFYVGNAATTERVPITINGEFLPARLAVRPGTILEWINRAGSPRTVIADSGAFSSDTALPNGIPNGERWIWVVPADARPGMKYAYHCRLQGEAGVGDAPGPGLAGVFEVVDPQADLPGLPRVTPASLPAFPILDMP